MTSKPAAVVPKVEAKKEEPKKVEAKKEEPKKVEPKKAEEKPKEEKKKDDVKVEDAEEDDEDDDNDEMPELENAADKKDDATGALKGGKQNRAEKKARKAMSKLGMKPVPGIVRVTVKKAKNILFVISKPDVFKSPASDTYVIFGEAKIEDITSNMQAQAADQFKEPSGASLSAQEALMAAMTASSGASTSTATSTTSSPSTATATAKPSGPEEAVDETGLDADEIQTIMSQTNSTRAQAAKALKKSGNIVDAILSLTP
eukprot:TRINITY_DN4_c0_g1_i1.p1 TRINITY_DN4_c0_g1~~TRINITY_DN4_c0_g1_i1.p1  ORF type:complete len:259 (-),score=100.11 TRINITY_DN4_c0_g1_i1:161-937(-)